MSPPRTGNAAILEGAEWAALWFARDAAARLIVSRDLAVLSLNQKAADLLQGAAALGLRDGVLVSRERRTMTDLAAMAAAATFTPRLRVLGTSEAGSLLVEAVALDAEVRGPVALSLRDLAAPTNIECADLEPMFGVTPGEHFVIVELLKGLSSREIAEASGKSVLTIRTHVKRAYGKIGVKTRGQLFARLLPYLSIR